MRMRPSSLKMFYIGMHGKIHSTRSTARLIIIVDLIFW